MDYNYKKIRKGLYHAIYNGFYVKIEHDKDAHLWIALVSKNRECVKLITGKALKDCIGFVDEYIDPSEVIG